MVTLDKIYTRGGDSGETSLAGGKRVAKHNPRIEAYGTIDEANSFIGVARLYADVSTDSELKHIQNDMFDIGADLAKPQKKSEDNGLRITLEHVEHIENQIDLYNQNLKPLKSFVLPGGSKASAFLHVARSIVRRAERVTTKLAEKEFVNAYIIIYLNRLSDYLFVMARFLNEKGSSDVLWEPGANIAPTNKNTNNSV